LPQDGGALTDAAWRALHAIDATTNCFPSGHITLPVVIGAGFCMQHPRLAPWAVATVVVLAPSVVTTGQHYAVDVLGGVATALFGLAVTRHPAMPALSRMWPRPG
jgi:membrane-associated phospholipid phosphatase